MEQWYEDEAAVQRAKNAVQNDASVRKLVEELEEQITSAQEAEQLEGFKNHYKELEEEKLAQIQDRIEHSDNMRAAVQYMKDVKDSPNIYSFNNPDEGRDIIRDIEQVEIESVLHKGNIPQEPVIHDEFADAFKVDKGWQYLDPLAVKQPSPMFVPSFQLDPAKLAELTWEYGRNTHVDGRTEQEKLAQRVSQLEHLVSTRIKDYDNRLNSLLELVAKSAETHELAAEAALAQKEAIQNLEIHTANYGALFDNHSESIGFLLDSLSVRGKSLREKSAASRGKCKAMGPGSYSSSEERILKTTKEVYQPARRNIFKEMLAEKRISNQAKREALGIIPEQSGGLKKPEWVQSPRPYSYLGSKMTFKEFVEFEWGEIKLAWAEKLTKFGKGLITAIKWLYK